MLEWDVGSPGGRVTGIECSDFVKQVSLRFTFQKGEKEMSLSIRDADIREKPSKLLVRFQVSAHFLHLGHGWRTSAANGASQVDTAAAGVDNREEQADGPGGPGEPQESGGSLRFAAATLAIVGAVGDMVVEGVFLSPGLANADIARGRRGESHVVAARMSAQLGGHGDSGAEQEDDIEQVDHDGEDGVAHEGVVKGNQDQVEERKHSKDGYEHVVVDQRRVAGEGHGNDVAGEGHDDEDEDELWAGIVRSWHRIVRVLCELPPPLGG